MLTHAIFILMSDAQCQAPFLRKNRPSWTTTQRSTQRSQVQKSGEPSDDKCVFSHIRHCRCDSQNVSGAHRVLSYRRNPSKPRVSQGAGVRWQWFRGNAIVATKIVHNSALWCTIVVATIALPRCNETYLALPNVLPYLTILYILPYLTLYLTLCLPLPYFLP